MATSSESSVIHHHSVCFDVWTASSLGDLIWLEENFAHEVMPIINHKNRHGWTPLMYAAYYGHFPVVNLLLKNGANVACANKSHKTALMLSVMGGNENCSNLLLQNGANANDKDAIGWTSLLYAASYGYPNITRSLITHGADINIQCGQTNATALMVACESGNIDVVRILLESGADSQILSSLRQTAYSMASDKNIIELLECSNHQNSRIHCGPRKVHELVRSSLKEAVPVEAKADIFEELETLLRSRGLEEYLPLFKEKKIDCSAFLNLAEDDLKKIGVVKVGPRLKMTCLIEEFKSQIPAMDNFLLDASDIDPVINVFTSEHSLKTRIAEKRDLVVTSSSMQNLFGLLQQTKCLLHLTQSLKNMCRSDEQKLSADFIDIIVKTNNLADEIHTKMDDVIQKICNV